MQSLNYDTSLVMPALMAMPTFESSLGSRLDASKSEIIVALAPVYLEFAALMRAIADRTGIKFPVVYGDPFPAPLMAPAEGVSMRSISNDVFVIDLPTGQILDGIPDGPCLLIQVLADTTGMTMVDATSLMRADD